jgi:WhiB family redox-sensing transcriptional regulator
LIGPGRRVSVAERRNTAAALVADGVNTREIAFRLGIDRRTVRRDVTAHRALASAPLPAPTSHGWMKQAVCAETDPELFFPEKSGDRGLEARRICSACPVRAECLTWGMDGPNTEFGIYGGVGPRARRNLAKIRRAA